MAGKLIVFEGLDRCGKSSQLLLLRNWLATVSDRPVVATKEPGGTMFGSGLRDLLLSTEVALDPMTTLLLFGGDRAAHVDQVIRPALDVGAWVLCDRFVASTLAYQGYGEGNVSLAAIARINAIATGGLSPDLTIWIDTDLATLASRRQGDRFESRDPSFHWRVRRGYEELCQDDARMVRVNGDRDVAAIARDVRAIVSQCCGSEDFPLTSSPA